MLRPTSSFSRLLYSRACMAFGAYEKETRKGLERTLQKARRKQSVTDVKKLQSYLGETGTSKTLNSAINRHAQYDKEFDAFFKQFKEKNKEFSNIIDLSHYARDQNVVKTEEMRKEELIMLEEFRRRRQERTLDMKSDDEGEERDAEEDDDALPEHTKERFSQVSMTRDAGRVVDEVLEEKMRRFYGDEKFLLVLLDRGVTTNVTTMNRVNHFRYLVFMGNMNGIIGYGKGKGGDFSIALQNALHNCKKNLVALHLDHFYSMTASVKVRYNGMRLEINPRRWMNGWGNPVMAHLLLLSGITHLDFNIAARNTTPYMLCYTLVKALTRVRTPQEIAETCGHKIYHNNFASWQYSQVRTEVLPNSGPAYRNN